MTEDKFRQAQIIAAYKRALLGTPSGKEVLLDIAAKSFLDRPTVTADPYMTYFNEGRRSMALDIFETLNVDVRQFMIENVTMEDV